MAGSATDYATHAAFVPALAGDALALLGAQPGERILDLGRGDGVLTARIAATGARVTSLDPDPSMLASARARGLDVVEGEGQRLGFAGAFDAVASNAALHWMPDQRAVADGVFRALKPGGRHVGECGGFRNIAAIRTAQRAVLERFGDDAAAGSGQVDLTPAAFVALHEAAGFVTVEARLMERPTPLPTGIRGWLRTFRAGLLAAAGVAPDGEERVAAAIEALLLPILVDETGTFVADDVRLRWQARKPA
ncbi:class I SAM-dependent methyltransferase [Thermaurantiacus sp.]